MWAVTARHELVQFAPHAPQQLLQRTPLAGLRPGEALVGIDHRVARGVLYALADSGQLYTLHTASGQATPVGQAHPVVAGVPGRGAGFDFNPVADRIRYVEPGGRNWRLHPDTGAPVDGDAAQPGLQPDAPLRWREGDPSAARAPRLVAAAYSYNKANDKLTTNYAIDAANGVLAMQGSLEGAQPVVSPNTGVLATVGPLGVGPLEDAAFDIADTDNTALAALRIYGRTALYRVDLASGHARRIGPVGDGSRLLGLAIEP